MRAALVDTAATIVFFTVVAGLVELFVVGMPFERVLFARGVMIPLMILTGRPYGLWRDFVFARAAPASPLARTLVDVAAFLTFQVPLYAATLVFSGASLPEIVAALAIATALMVPLGRPFGIFLEAMRRFASTAGAGATDGERPSGRRR